MIPKSATFQSENTLADSQTSIEDWRSYFEEHSETFDPDRECERLEKRKGRLLADKETNVRTVTVDYSRGIESRVQSAILSEVQSGVHGDQPGSQSVVKSRVQISNGIIASQSDLERHRDCLKPKQDLYFIIQPLFSWDVLPISEWILWSVLTSFAVFPGIFDLLHQFGAKCDEIDEDFAVYHHHIDRDADSTTPGRTIRAFEMLHNFKYPVSRPDVTNPETNVWVTRKIGLYSKYCPANDTTTWILIQPQQGCFMDRVEKVLQKLAKRHDHEEVRLLFLKEAGHGWNTYMNELERDFRQLDGKVFCWRPDQKPASPNMELEMPDTQRIQNFKVKLHELEHALDVNAAIIESIRRGLLHFKNEGGNDYAERYSKYDPQFKELSIQITQERTRVKHLIRCVDGLFSLVCTLIPYMFARRENQLMLQLSEKGTQYAKSMKIITILCMAFLPPSLIAAIFGMGIFGNPELGVGPMLGLFFFVSLLLCVLTYGSWLVWDRRRKRQSDDEEKAQSSAEVPDGGKERIIGPGPRSETASVEYREEEKFTDASWYHKTEAQSSIRAVDHGGQE